MTLLTLSESLADARILSLSYPGATELQFDVIIFQLFCVILKRNDSFVRNMKLKFDVHMKIQKMNEVYNTLVFSRLALA